MKYIFIGGVPRSGTSLIQKILSFHPRISAGPEFDHIPEIIQLYSRMKGGIESGRQSAFFNEVEIQKIFRTFIDKLFEKRIEENTEYVSEKTPSNALFFENLIEIDSSFKLVFVVRDPRGIIASMKEVAIRAKTNRTNTNVNIGIDLLNDLALINSYYLKASNTIKKYPDNIFVLNYEDILKSPKDMIVSLCKYLNIDFFSEMLDTSKENEMSKLVENTTISAHYTREMYDRKISISGIDRWRNIINNKDASIIEHYFASKDYNFLKSYNFQNQKFETKLRYNYIKLKHKICH